MTFDPSTSPLDEAADGIASVGDDSLFRAIFDQAGVGIALLDCAGRAIEINRALSCMLDQPVAMLGRGLVGEDGLAAWQPLLDGQVRQLRFDRPFHRADGLVLSLRVTVSAAREADRLTPRYLIAIVEDHTEQRYAEEALKSAEAKYRGIFENAVEGIFQTTPDGRYLAANPALARIYGYDSAAELIDGLTNIASQLYVDAERRHEFARVLSTHDEVHDFVSQVRRKDGSVIWISEDCRAVRDEAGTLLYYEGLVQDITEQKRAEAQLVHDALHDSLTGLPNRTLFLDRLGRALRHWRRHGNGLAVLFIDCDRFKLINDSLGHLVGDQLLIELSGRITRCLRASDTLARLGGDEFVVLAEDLDDRADGVAVAERIREALSLPYQLEGEAYYLTTSIGIAFASADDAQPGQLLRDADTAMYEAKSGGRDRVAVFEPGMHLQAVSQLQVASDLRRAVERGEFVLYYQPIMQMQGGEDDRPGAERNARRGGLAGFESLVRWKHPSRGLVLPDQFIPVAEETGLVHAIGEWVLATACRQLAEWRAAYGAAAEALFVSVNLAPSQLQRPDIVEEIGGLVAGAGVPAEAIRLEITESGIMDNPLSVRGKLEALKAKGFRIAIDDFGTGYSSLAHLHRFPIDTLKVDRSFIAAMAQGGEHVEIVRTILMLGESLGMTVVAEGVETAEHDGLLRHLRCAYGQGWHYAKPLGPAAAADFVAERLEGPGTRE